MNTSVPECIGHVYIPWSLAADGVKGFLARDGESVGTCAATSDGGLEVRMPSALGADVLDMLSAPVVAVGAVGCGTGAAGGSL